MLINRIQKRLFTADRPADAGVAMLLALIWGTVLILLATVAAAAAINSIQSSGRSERSFGALAAAEAGIDDYIARLAANPLYFTVADPTNAAFTGWVDVPGGSSDTDFTYTIDSSKVNSDGILTIISTGRSGNVMRTVQSTLRRPSTVDYTYFSDYETMDPYVPGAYADLATALALCEERLWWEPGPVGPNASSPNGTNRNSNYCQFASIYPSERLKGNIHTNDAWYFDGNLSSTFQGRVTSSCPASKCPPNHRWIDASRSGINSNTSGAGSLSAGTVPSKPNDMPSSDWSTTTPVAWNPGYQPLLPLPVANTKLRDTAEEDGCVFTGPTRILLKADGTMEVTSPATKVVPTQCGGTGLRATSATTHPTVTITTKPITGGFNGVVYVQSLPTNPSDPNYWAPGTAPTCLNKNGSNNKPYVIPANESSKFAPVSGDRGGFPSAQDNSPTTPTAWFDCTKGDIFLQGVLNGNVTLAAENNIGLTGHTYYVDANTSVPLTNAGFGYPPADSPNVLGLIPNNFLYVYNPVNTRSSNTDSRKRVSDWLPYLNGTASTTTWNANRQQNLLFNFGALAIDHCFGTQNASSSIGANGGGIYLRGSLGQKYRCIVGYGTQGSSSQRGYSKFYAYDDRLRFLSPPYMLSLSEVPWRQNLVTETSTHTVSATLAGLVDNTVSIARNATVNVTPLTNDPAGTSIVSVTAPSSKVTVVSFTEAGQVRIKAGSTTGSVVLTVLTKRSDGLQATQNLTVTVT
jgi:hypothetical protein